jgi:hypothetical protein
VIVWAPRLGATFFATVAIGETVVSTAGRTVFTPATRRVEPAGTRPVHPLELGSFTPLLGASAEDLVTQWSALSSAAGASTDWWPDDLPVALGELRGGEGVKTDAGLRVESDVLLFRVLGEGGTP